MKSQVQELFLNNQPKVDAYTAQVVDPWNELNSRLDDLIQARSNLLDSSRRYLHGHQALVQIADDLSSNIDKTHTALDVLLDIKESELKVTIQELKFVYLGNGWCSSLCITFSKDACKVCCTR